MTDIEYRTNKRNQAYHELLLKAQERTDFTDKASIEAYNEYARRLRKELMGDDDKEG